MKNLFCYLTLLIIGGCQALSQTSQQLTQIPISCAEKPKVILSKENVTEISLEDQIVNKSSQASADKTVGYTFTAQAGQKLSYHTKDDVCIWIYTPDNQLLNSGELPQSGKYTLQISAPKGSTTFNLEMSLGTLEASQPSETSSSSAENSTSETSTSTSSIVEVANLNQEQALQLVQKWYKAKPQIFGPSFDQSLVEQYATGKLYQDKLKPGGSIDWLRSHDSYYTYDYSRVNNVISFSNSSSRPSIIVNVSEELYLHHPRGIDRKNSGAYNADFIYFFDKDNGVWKLSDYKKIS